MSKLNRIKFLCSLFPPLVAQQVRERLISIPAAEKMAVDFKRRAFTGSYLFGNTSDFHAFKFFIHGYFDWRNIVLAHSILKIKKGDIIEVGANIGTETISLADISSKNKVHAFEPLPVNFSSLKDIRDKNELKHLHLYNVLVSDKKGEAYFKVPPPNSSGSGHIADSSHPETTKFDVVTLDEELKAISSCAAIIADVEGYEPQVLAGAQQLIKRTKPFLILEVNARFLKERANTSVEAFYQDISQMGYTPFYIGRLGISQVDPTDFKTRTNKNWLCIPNEHIKHRSRLSRTIFWNAFNPFMRFKIL